MLSKATTKVALVNLFLMLEKIFFLPSQAVTLYLSGSRQYHDRQSIRMILRVYSVKIKNEKRHFPLVALQN